MIRNVISKSVIFCSLLALSNCDPDGYYVEQRQSSPDGQWLAEVHVFAFGPPRVTLRRAGTSARAYDALTAGENGNSGLLLKWQGSSQLVVAAADEKFYSKKTDNIDGTNTSYLVYPTEPDSFQLEGSQRILRYNVPFISKFKEQLNIATPKGVGCVLSVVSANEPVGRQIRLRLTADKDLYVGAPQSMKSFGSMAISAPQYILEPHRYITAAAFDSFAAGKDTGIRNLSQFADPGWQAWQMIGKADLFLILDRLKSDFVEFEFGFWLDNTEEIYMNSRSLDLHAIQQFEQCIAQKAIFE